MDSRLGLVSPAWYPSPCTLLGSSCKPSLRSYRSPKEIIFNQCKNDFRTAKFMCAVTACHICVCGIQFFTGFRPALCKGKTKSLADAFPESIGKRSKRFSPDETYFRPLSNGPIHMCCLRPCGYKELSEYCAEDEPTRSSDDP
ncbi:hypothetical protein ACLKA6_007171 [Drosophila palustris]